MTMRNIITILLLGTCTAFAAAGQTGRTAADYLNLMPNARAAAMGDGTIALLADEPSSVMVNPAALAGVTRPWMAFHYLALPGDIPYNFTSFCIPSSVGALGASLIYVPYGSSAGYDATGASIDVPSSYDSAVMISGAIPIAAQLPVYKEYGYLGASLKFMHEALAYYSTEAIALDLGAIINMPLVPGLTAGATYKNIGTGMKFVTEDNSLPAGVSYGMAYHNPSWWDMIATVDSLAAANGPARMAAGLSISPVYFLTMRTGYRDDADSLVSGIRLGLGLRFGSFSLDYAFTPINYFSPKHTLSVCMSIGGLTRMDTASDYYLNQHFRQACEQYYKKDYIAARQRFEEILSIYPDHLPSQKYLTKIISAVEAADQRKQDAVEEWLVKADDAFEKKDLITAGKYYNRVLKISMNSGMAQGGIDRIRQMIAEVKRENDRQENQVVINKIWKRALARFHKGDYVRAKDDFKDILYIDPKHTESKKYLVEIDNQLTKIAAARINELFDQGMKLYKSGNYAEAIKYFDAVFIAAPHRLDAQDLSLKAQESISAAQLKLHDSAVAKEQDLNRSEMAALFDKALKYYEKANYETALTWFTKSETFASEHEFTEFRESARNYLTLVKNTLAEKHYKRGFNYARGNDIERAAEEYKKALEYEPTNTSAQIELDRISDDIAQRYFERGMEFFSLNQMDKAREMFKKSLSYQPDKAESQRALERIK